MAADELGGGMQHNVGAVLQGPDEIGGAEGIVDDQGQPEKKVEKTKAAPVRCCSQRLVLLSFLLFYAQLSPL